MDSENTRWPQFLVVVTVTIAALTAGLHTGWPISSFPDLSSYEDVREYRYDIFSYITIGIWGNFFGSFVGYIFLDKIGRRKTVLLIALPQGISLLCIALSHYLVEVLYLGRFMGGVGEGMVITIILLYIGEIAEPTIRGTLATFVSITWYLGVLFVNIVSWYLSITNTALTFIALPVLFVALFWKMPESPYYLLMKNEEEEAERSLKFLRRKPDVCPELTKLKDEVRRQMSESGTFKDIFTIDSNRRAFFVTVGARFFQLATGLASFIHYLSIYLEVSGPTTRQGVLVAWIIVYVIQLVATVVSTFIIDKCGRKPLLLWSSIGCFFSLAIQSVFHTLREHTYVHLSEFFFWLVFSAMLLHIFVYPLGLGVVVNVFTSEMFSVCIKAKMICLVNACYALMTLAFLKYYEWTLWRWGLMVPVLSYAGLSFVGVLFIWFIVPETKRQSLEEIQQNLKKRENEHQMTVF